MAKLRSRRGLTLVEALITVLILSLISLAIATGLIVATNAQSQSVFESESGLLANTINLALSDVLRYAVCTDATSDPITFRNDNDKYSFGAEEHFYIDGEGRLTMTSDTGGTGGMPLVDDYFGMIMIKTDPADPDNDWKLSYNAADRVFSGSYTLTDATGTLSRTFTFSFKTLITP